MARIGSSSKSKSKSKSSKRKHSKISSKTRRSKTSRRDKSKKVHRRDDSASSYSDESSRSLSISLSSDSEDDYRSRKGRSRVRDSAKSNRKRVRRISSSRESSVDSPPVKKRKWSKRNGDSKVRRKIQKKKYRRTASISSSSSDSRNCSPRHRGNTSDSEESEFERIRGRSREKRKDRRSSGNARSGTSKSKMRSRSCSSCSRYSNSSDNQSKGKVAGESYSRRLRSVITVAKPLDDKEETEQDKDKHKEEIYYDQDDYPSCRSNDSNDGGKRGLAHHSSIASEKTMVESLMRKEALVSEHTSKESKLSSGDRNDKYDESYAHSDEGRTKIPEKESEIDVSATVAGSGSDSLESILRQKALENLMKFRGGPQKNAKTPTDHENKVEGDVKLCTAKADFILNKSPEQEQSSGVGETRSVDQNNKSMRKDSFRPMQKTAEKNLDGRDGGIKPRGAIQRVVHPSNGAAISGNPKDKDCKTTHAVNNESESNTSALRQQSSITGSSMKQASPLHVSPKAISPITKNILNRSVAETFQTVAGSSSKNPSVVVIDACGAAPEPSCVKPTSEEHSSRECQDESKTNSQFEQKTMSVMRGGEMVQVSYKVYIPNKAPALARRRLQR